MQGISISWKVTADESHFLLRDFLRKKKSISRLALTDIKKNGHIFLNDIAVTVRAPLKAGDIVKVVFPPEQRSQSMKPTSNIPLVIVYEDEHLLVINKQANLPTIPSIYHPDYSLANAVLHYYDENEIQSTFHAVNRLDKDTSGLLIIAKHRYAHDLFSNQQRDGKINRTYKAFVHGEIARQEGIIDAPIGRKEDSIIEREVRCDGQTAITEYRVIDYFPNGTIVELSLKTGRTHQIRVHMASIGHPLLGDDLYGGTLEKISRQALHSWKLSFIHPIDQKEMNFIVELPDDMKAIMF